MRRVICDSQRISRQPLDLKPIPMRAASSSSTSCSRQSSSRSTSGKPMSIYTPGLSQLEDTPAATLELNNGCFPTRNPPQYPIQQILQSLQQQQQKAESTDQPKREITHNQLRSRPILKEIVITPDSISVPTSTKHASSPSTYYSSLKAGGFLNQLLNTRPAYNNNTSITQKMNTSATITTTPTTVSTPTQNTYFQKSSQSSKNITMDKIDYWAKPVLRVRSTMRSRDERLPSFEGLIQQAPHSAKYATRQVFVLPEMPEDVSDSQRHQYSRRDPREEKNKSQLINCNASVEAVTTTTSNNNDSKNTQQKTRNPSNQKENLNLDNIDIKSQDQAVDSSSNLKNTKIEIEGIRSKRASSFTLQPKQLNTISNYQGTASILRERKVIQPILSRRSSEVNRNCLFGYHVSSLSSTLPANDGENTDAVQTIEITKKHSLLSSSQSEVEREKRKMVEEQEKEVIDSSRDSAELARVSFRITRNAKHPTSETRVLQSLR